MIRKKFLIFIVLFFSKIFTIKCERKVRLYLFFKVSLYRYFSEKNKEYNDFKYIDDIHGLNTDYKIEDNILDLKEIDEKIKKNQIIFKDDRNDFYEANKNINIKNCKITSLKLLSEIERKGFSYQFEKELKENFHQYKIEDLNNKVKIPDNVDFVYIFIEDFSNIDSFKKGTIKYLLLSNNNNFHKKEDFKDITDSIKISDLYENQKYIEKCDYDENIQLKELLNNKLFNDAEYKDLKFKFNNFIKKGDEEFKIEDLKKMGVFVSSTHLRKSDYDWLYSKDIENLNNYNMYLRCDIKFKRKVKIIFNIPENTELDLGLGMKQEAEIEFTSFNQESIEEGLKKAINEIFDNKGRLDNKHCFQLEFWQGNEGIWPEKYIVKKENGDTICTITGFDKDNYIDITDKDNLTFEIYLKPGSELLKGIHVTLHFKPVEGKFVSKELGKMPKNTDFIGWASSPQSVFLCKGENYINQIKYILKEGYFNKQKISLDDDCYGLYLRTYAGDEEQFTPLTDNNQLNNDIPMIFILFNNNANGKYIKDSADAPDPVYYGNGKDTGRDKDKFVDTYEYDYKYIYKSVTGNFENYYNYFNKTNSQVQYIKEDSNPGDGNPGDGNPNYTPITTPEEINDKNLKKLNYCAKCMKCCCCKRNV